MFCPFTEKYSQILLSTWLKLINIHVHGNPQSIDWLNGGYSIGISPNG